MKRNLIVPHAEISEYLGQVPAMPDCAIEDETLKNCGLISITRSKPVGSAVRTRDLPYSRVAGVYDQGPPAACGILCPVTPGRDSRGT